MEKKWVNKYNLKIHNHYLFEVDFEYSSKLIEEHKENIIYNFAYNIENIKKTDGSNVVYSNKKLNSQISQNYYDIINHHFRVPKDKREFNLFTYVQTKEEFTSVPHNHALGAEISATTYLGEPKKGGYLSLFFGERIMKLKPKKGKLYLFPSWLFHAPTPHYDDCTRICINIDFRSETRPEIKIPREYFNEGLNSIVGNNKFLW